VVLDPVLASGLETFADAAVLAALAHLLRAPPC
jgi:hypothetical protein